MVDDSGAVYDVGDADRPRFDELMKGRAQQRHTFRGKDGQTYNVPEADRERFQSLVPDAEEIHRFQMDDGGTIDVDERAISRLREGLMRDPTLPIGTDREEARATVSRRNWREAGLPEKYGRSQRERDEVSRFIVGAYEGDVKAEADRMAAEGKKAEELYSPEARAKAEEEYIGMLKRHREIEKALARAKAGETELGPLERMYQEDIASKGADEGVLEFISRRIPVIGSFVKLDDKRVNYVMGNLANGEYSNPMEMAKVALSIGIPEETVRRINEQVDDGPRETRSERAKELWMEELAGAYAQRQDMRRRSEMALGEAAAPSMAAQVAQGAIELPKTVAEMTGPGVATSGFANYMDRAASLVERGDSEGTALAKAAASYGGELFIWNKLGKVIEALPGVGGFVKSAGQKLARSKIAGNVVMRNAGQILEMNVKSGLTELVNEVVGMGKADSEEKKAFSDWFQEFVSVPGNAKKMLMMLPAHLMMKGAGKGKQMMTKEGREAARSIDAQREVIKATIGEDAARGLSDLDVRNIYSVMSSPAMSENTISAMLSFIEGKAGTENRQGALREYRKVLRESRVRAENQEAAREGARRAYEEQDASIHENAIKREAARRGITDEKEVKKFGKLYDEYYATKTSKPFDEWMEERKSAQRAENEAAREAKRTAKAEKAADAARAEQERLQAEAEQEAAIKERAEEEAKPNAAVEEMKAAEAEAAAPKPRTEEYPEYAEWLRKNGRSDTDKNWNKFVAQNEMDPALKVVRDKKGKPVKPEAKEPEVSEQKPVEKPQGQEGKTQGQEGKTPEPPAPAKKEVAEEAKPPVRETEDAGNPAKTEPAITPSAEGATAQPEIGKPEVKSGGRLIADIPVGEEFEYQGRKMVKTADGNILENPTITIGKDGKPVLTGKPVRKKMSGAVEDAEMQMQVKPPAAEPAKTAPAGAPRAEGATAPPKGADAPQGAETGTGDAVKPKSDGKGKMVKPAPTAQPKSTAPVVDETGKTAEVVPPDSVEARISAMKRGSPEQLAAQREYFEKEIAKARAAIDGKFDEQKDYRGKHEGWTPKEDAGDIPPTVTVKVPGDGEFTVRNTPDGMAFLDKIAAKFKPQKSGKAAEVSAPSVPRPPTVAVAKNPKDEAAHKEMEPFVSTDRTRASLAKPMSDGEYVYATNGKIVVRRPLRKGEVVKGVDGAPVESVAGFFDNPDPNHSFKVKVAELYPKLVQADAVTGEGDGKGIVELWHDGNGTLHVRARDGEGNSYATDAGSDYVSRPLTLVNGQYLRDFLKLAAKRGAGEVEIGIVENGIAKQADAVTLKGGDLEGVLVSIRNSKDMFKARAENDARLETNRMLAYGERAWVDSLPKKLREERDGLVATASQSGTAIDNDLKAKIAKAKDDLAAFDAKHGKSEFVSEFVKNGGKAPAKPKKGKGGADGKLKAVNPDAEEVPASGAPKPQTPEQEIAERLDLARLDPKRRSDPKVLEWAKKNGRTVTNGMVTPDAVRAYDEQMTERAAKQGRRWFPDMKIVVHKYGETIKRGQHVLDLRDTAGRTLGWFDPQSKEVHLLPGADPQTVAHEIMWHGTRDYFATRAAKGDALAQKVLDKMKDVELHAPQDIKDIVNRLYARGGVPVDRDTLMNEYGAWFTMKRGGYALEKAMQKAENRNWFARGLAAVKEMYKDYLTRHGKNRVDLSAVDGMSRDQFVDWIAEQFAGGKSLGTIKGDPQKVLSTKETRMQAYRRKAYDNNAPLRDLERDVEKKTGRKISTDDSVEAANALKHGLKEAANIEIQGKMSDFRKALGESGIHYEDLEYYAALKAAAGRDAKIDARNLAKIEADMRAQGASQADIDAAKARYRSVNGSHIDPREARRMIAEIEGGPDAAKYKAAYDKLRAVIDETLAVQEQSGLVGAADAAKWRAEEPDYVPFKNEYEPETGEWAGRGSSRNFTRPEHHTAKGRQSAAGDIIAHVFMDHQAAKHRAIENAVRQKLAKLVRANPELGTVERLGKDAVRNIEKDDPNVVVFKEGGNSYAIRLEGTRGAAIANAFTERNLLKMGWADKGLSVFGKKISFRSFSHWSAGMATLYSPTFAVRNTLKDNIELANIVYSERGLMAGLKWMGQYVANRAKMSKTLIKYVATGRVDASTPEGALLDRYIKAGGLIAGGTRAEAFEGIKQKLSPEAVAKEMKRGSSKTRAAAKHVLKSVAYLNEYAEMATRLGVFATEVKGGKSDAEAALFSRRVTVDFNRHGDYTPAFNMLRLFSNSTLGATARAATALCKNKFGKRAALLMFANGLARAFIDHYLNEDEDKAREARGDATGKDVSEYDRRTSLFYFRYGDKTYKVAQHESPFSLITYAGDCVGRWLCGDLGGAEAAKNIGVTTAELAWNFTPMGQINATSREGGGVNDFKAALVSGVCPSILQPIAELGANIDHKGDPAFRQMFDNYAPQSHNGKAHTPDWAKSAAEWANEATGGNAGRRGWLDIAPEAVQKLVEGYGKNALRDVSMALSVGKAIVKGNMSGLDPRDTPVKRDFVRPLDGNDGRYFQAVDRHKADRKDFDTGRATRSKEENESYLAAHPSAYNSVHQSLGKIEDAVNRLRKMEDGYAVPKKGAAVPHKWTDEELERFRGERRRLQAQYLSIMQRMDERAK